VRRLVAEGLVERDLLPAPAPDRLLAVVVGIPHCDPGATLRAIGARLKAIRERTPRGGTTWRPGSVAHVVARARKAGLCRPRRPIRRRAQRGIAAEPPLSGRVLR